MSPVSRNRRRNGKRRSVRGGAPLVVVGEPSECDCPYCADAPPGDVGALLPEAIDVGAVQDPVEVEIAAAMVLAVVSAMGPDFDAAVREQFVPSVEAQATPSARAMLSGIASVADGETGRAAAAAARRLADAGVDAPPWLTELDVPVAAQECHRFVHADDGAVIVLMARFERAGRTYAVFVPIEDVECGAAHDIVLGDPDGWDRARATLLANLRADGVDVVTEPMPPADFRRAVEDALDARADHDRDDEALDDILEEEDGPGYAALALLLRSWLRALPATRRDRRGHRHDESDAARLFGLLGLLATTPSGRAVPAPRRAAGPPAKRKKSDGPAPIYQLKVGLRGARPPIWRRLEVPADVSLVRLHDLIQVAFGWTDSHLHAFETPYGAFARRADPELGHRAGSRVTLEQVAPAAGDKLRYTYDFGDGWEHDILVEKVLDRVASVAYPRCVGGRRAGPPEDCGGVWGYAELVEILADPTHPEHRDRLDWLDLDDPADFDPARFDAKAVTASLQRVR
ncbi:plasmid pRiA4b ORF-3 family protein [Micromonospora sp. NPDC050686]|uniref:plasmid pRiA4b ORF-3 family protein n=1 Tax=Micromonospora sp. NPDC050686 TaxID=3154631 RepID=UPI0034049F16